MDKLHGAVIHPRPFSSLRQLEQEQRPSEQFQWQKEQMDENWWWQTRYLQQDATYNNNNDDEDEDEDDIFTDAPLSSMVWDIECSLEISNDSPACEGLETAYGSTTDICQVDTDDMDKKDNGVTILPKDVLVPFDYEIYFTSQEIPLDFVQGWLLWHLAQEWSLLPCTTTTTTGGTHSPTRYLLEQEIDQVETIVAISIGIPDQVDYGEPCASLVEQAIMDIATCRRIQGQVTVYYQDDNDEDSRELIVTSTVLTLIRSLMLNDALVTPGNGITGSLERVMFMGQRQDNNNNDDYGNGTDVSGPSFSDKVNDSEFGDDNDNGPSISWIGIILIILLVLTVIMAILVAIRKKGKHQLGGQCDIDAKSDGHEDDHIRTRGEGTTGSCSTGTREELPTDDLEANVHAGEGEQVPGEEHVVDLSDADENTVRAENRTTCTSHSSKSSDTQSHHSDTKQSVVLTDENILSSNETPNSKTLKDQEAPPNPTSILEKLSEPISVASWVDHDDESDVNVGIVDRGSEKDSRLETDGTLETCAHQAGSIPATMIPPETSQPSEQLVTREGS